MKEKYRDFHFGEFIEKPNQCGYFEQMEIGIHT